MLTGLGVAATEMSTEAQVVPSKPVLEPGVALLRARALRRIGGVVLLALAYYGSAKLGQTLRYTASVSAIWPPAGVGMAALYLWGLRWWPGIFLGELWINVELLLDDSGIPFWSIVGQQVGNMLEIVLGALLLRRLLGPRAALDRADQIAGMLFALACGTAVSAAIGTASMLGGGVIDRSEADTFFRTWWLGDTAGALVALPLILTWAQDPRAAWRKIRTWEGGLLFAAVGVLAAISVSSDEPVTYMLFPALIWAALRFGPPGATLAIAVAAGVAIGFTANEVGPFFKQPIDHRTLSTQLYIGVAAITTLFVSALVSERQRSLSALAEAKRREGEGAIEERHRIARDLHDSVSQALFSTALQTRTAERALAQEGSIGTGMLRASLTAISELTADAQREMRALLFELNGAGAEDGLVSALSRHAAELTTPGELTVDVRGPAKPLPLSRAAEAQFLRIGSEALANVVKHSAARRASVRVDATGSSVAMEVRDDGVGFDATAKHPGHYGLESMRSRAAELGALLTFESTPGFGTVVRVEMPVSKQIPRDR
jgi:signal transduction histidine kinase